MKDIKSYVIGFLTCACLFLIMGQTGSEKDADWEDIFSGKYKAGLPGKYSITMSDDGTKVFLLANNSGQAYRYHPGKIGDFKSDWHPVTMIEAK